ncbi:MAG: hypothetical protein WD981_00025, partial [Gaiellaceae bacterium]
MRLDHVDIPGEHEARERTWEVVQAAFAEREPAPLAPRRLAPALAFAVVAAALAAAFTPPGRAVVDKVREAIGVEAAEQALFSLPADGRLLVVSDSGAWAVSRDGSKRRLGDYREASCSPFGRFVVVARANELAALEPDGDVRWKLARPNVHAPAWGGTTTDTRIAYLSGETLRVVAGDGAGDHLIGPADRFRWLPGRAHRLAVTVGGRTSVVDADTGAVVSREPLPASRKARVRKSGATSELVVGRRVRFEGTGTFRDLTWSPDGRWLAFVWPDVDQIVFVTATGPRRIEAAANLTAQFE